MQVNTKKNGKENKQKWTKRMYRWYQIRTIFACHRHIITEDDSINGYVIHLTDRQIDENFPIHYPEREGLKIMQG